MSVKIKVSISRRSLKTLLLKSTLVVFMVIILVPSTVTTVLGEEETQNISVRGVPKSTWKATRLEALRHDMSASQFIIKLLNERVAEINELKVN